MFGKDFYFPAYKQTVNTFSEDCFLPQIKALGGAEKLLREIASSSLDAIYFKDRESRWLYANPSLERIAGKPSSELLGKTDAEIY